MPEFKSFFKKFDGQYHCFAQDLYSINPFSFEFEHLFLLENNEGFESRFDFADRVNNLLCFNGYEELV